jgi:hypothetical protein
MDKDVMNSNSEGKDCKPWRVYSHAQQLLNNLPYVVMSVLGAAIFVVGLQNPAKGWLAAGIYAAYAAAGALWVMIFICPYCHYCDTMSCPCGYGRIAAKLREKKDGDRFREKFKKHIPVIVGLWLIPVVAGVIFLAHKFSWPVLILLVAFAVDAFVVLPLHSKKHGCAECPQKDRCPWMRTGKQDG